MTDPEDIKRHYVASENPQEKKFMRKIFDISSSTADYWLKHPSNWDADEQVWVDTIREIARDKPRYGYRRIHREVMKRLGIVCNVKRIYRIYRQLSLDLPVKKKRRVSRDGLIDRIPQAEYRNHYWAMDFVFDCDVNGYPIKILNIVDVRTRYLIDSVGGRSLKSKDVAAALERNFRIHGMPENILSDNGPEFRAKYLDQCLKRHRVRHFFTLPGKPFMNGHVESLNGKMRDEFLSVELFDDLSDFRRKLERFKSYYNRERQHSSIQYRTPEDAYGLSA